MLSALALALTLRALPPAEQYTYESFPLALQSHLRKRQALEERHLDAGSLPAPLWLVWRLPAGKGATAWALGEGCEDEGTCRWTLLFLQRGREFQLAGVFKGAPDEALGGAPTPPELVLARREPQKGIERTHLVYRDGAYQAGKSEERFEDPLTRSLVSRGELDRAADDDFVAGRYVAAAGRWSVLCQAGCTAAQHAKQGRAALRASLFPAAERALRKALAADATLDVARLDLGDVLATEGKLGEARALYEAAAQSHDADLSASAKARLEKLAKPVPQ
jgi:tetratricopeptide (TPR) repeat protein